MRRLMMTMTVATMALVPGIASAQSGDAAAGQRVFNQCRACHTPDQGGRNGVGPNLWGIVGRRAASIEGFRYSANMRTLGEGGHTWTTDNLNAYITNPKAVAPQGSMSYPGLRNAEQLANLIAYLETLK
ncbi:cytochrome c family protein [Roseomonas sp. CECT 9278]|uniref:c-type cytochrome n=1 Tax=Roseomonas sp. CECT 9278 TaxID=2845823 RepID=UPI001E2F4A21|nr:cytochrome c family protein [Roseomonas sp. CECT 9278]CAH0241846.1 Cytochrome c2 [Roseomonas sp. CECT 9278]